MTRARRRKYRHADSVLRTPGAWTGVQMAEAGMAPSARDEGKEGLAPGRGPVAGGGGGRSFRGVEVLYWQESRVGDKDMKQGRVEQEGEPEGKVLRAGGG